MKMNRLIDIVEPPNDPSDVPPEKYWEQYTIKFPTDYISFIGIYGSGVIGDIYWHNPYSRSPFRNIFNMLLLFDQACRDPITPDVAALNLKAGLFRGGVIPIAQDGTGFCIVWNVCDPNEPDQWTVSVIDDDDVLHQYSCGWVDFLVDGLEGKIESYLFGGGKTFKQLSS